MSVPIEICSDCDNFGAQRLDDPKMRRVTRIVRPLLRPNATRVLARNTLHTFWRPLPPPCRVVPWSFRRYYSSNTPAASSSSTETASAAKACPGCGSPLDLREISCSECGALAPLPEDINYLTLFNIPADQPFRFDIDVGALKREYLKLMSKVHPDSVINSSDVILFLFPFLLTPFPPLLHSLTPFPLSRGHH